MFPPCSASGHMLTPRASCELMFQEDSGDAQAGASGRVRERDSCDNKSGQRALTRRVSLETNIKPADDRLFMGLQQ